MKENKPTLREDFSKELQKYISDTKCQVFHTHDNMFLADRLIDLIKSRLPDLTVIGDEEYRETFKEVQLLKDCLLSFEFERKLCQKQLSHTIKEIGDWLK